MKMKVKMRNITIYTLDNRTKSVTPILQALIPQRKLKNRQRENHRLNDVCS